MPTKLEMFLAATQLSALPWTNDFEASIRRATPIFLSLIHVANLHCTIDPVLQIVRFDGEYHGAPACREVSFAEIEDFFITATAGNSGNATTVTLKT